METALLNYFLDGTELHATCDFNPYILEKGVSIYEVLRVEQRVPAFLQEHIDRFFSSAALENITVNISGKFIRQVVKLLIEQNRMQQGNIKFLFHWTGQDDGRFMAWVMPFFFPPDRYYAEGVVVGSMQAERENPNAKKTLHSLRYQADAFIKNENLWEVIYVNLRGNITEGSRSNIFFVRGDNLVTPKLSLVLPGITRAKVMQMATTKGVKSEEANIKPFEIEKFDACFLTGTSPKILPVLRFGNHTFDVQNVLMRQLISGYDEMMAEEMARDKY